MSTTETEDMHKVLEEMLTDENASAILTTLRLYAPLNLKGISHLLGKAESTLHRHMAKLREDELVIPADAVDLPGKYYKLHPLVQNFYKTRIETAIEEFEEGINEMLDVIEKVQGEDPEEREAAIKTVSEEIEDSFSAIKSRKNSIEANFTVNKNMQSLVLQQILSFPEKYEINEQNILEFIKDPSMIGALNSLSFTVDVSTPQDSIDLIRAIIQFVEKANKISERTEKAKEANPDLETYQYYINLFSGRLSKEIDPQDI